MSPGVARKEVSDESAVEEDGGNDPHATHKPQREPEIGGMEAELVTQVEDVDGEDGLGPVAPGTGAQSEEESQQQVYADPEDEDDDGRPLGNIEIPADELDDSPQRVDQEEADQELDPDRGLVSRRLGETDRFLIILVGQGASLGMRRMRRFLRRKRGVSEGGPRASPRRHEDRDAVVLALPSDVAEHEVGAAIAVQVVHQRQD